MSVLGIAYAVASIIGPAVFVCWMAKVLMR